MKKRRPIWIGLVIITGLSLMAYSRTATYSFFWEDPFDLGQVATNGLRGIATTGTSNIYYRPLSLLLLLALGRPDGTFVPWPYHVLQVVAHALAAGLVFLLSLSLRRSWLSALFTGLLFSLYPLGFEAIARVTTPQPLLMVMLIGSLIFYIRARTKGRWRWQWASLALAGLALPFHENALALPFMILSLDLYLIAAGRVTAPLARAPANPTFLRLPPVSRFIVWYFLAAGLFSVIWIAIPKSPGASRLGFSGEGAAYFLQALAYPVVGAIWRLAPTGDDLWRWGALWAGTALTMALLALAYGRAGRWREMALGLAWFGLLAGPAWVVRDYAYLAVSPRVLYPSALATAMVWGGALEGLRGKGSEGKEGNKGTLGANSLASFISRSSYCVALALLAQSFADVRAVSGLYRVGSSINWQILAAGERAGGSGRLTFVNTPDRFELKRRLYPLGYWGMLVAPVSRSLSDFVWLASGRRPQTESLTVRPAYAAQIAASPYWLNSRGSDADPAALYQMAARSDEVYLAEYWPDGEVRIAPAGQVLADRAPSRCLATFGAVAALCEASSKREPDALVLTLHWASLSDARPNDTIFVHLVDSSGALAVGADGDSLAGLIPLPDWRPGDIIRDVRWIRLPTGLPVGHYQVRVGLYNRASGERYPAVGGDGQGLPDNAVTALELDLP